MLKLGSKQIEAISEVTAGQDILRITRNSTLPEVLRPKHILLLEDETVMDIPQNFHSYFLFNKSKEKHSSSIKNIFALAEELNYLQEGDVVRFIPQTTAIRTLYRKNSNHNSLLVTERCNNFCLMCSQPPKEVDDSFLVDDLLKAIPLMDRSTVELGISGGEPTLLGDRFIELLWAGKNFLPDTALHVLSNGRSFASQELAEKVAAINHPDLMIGIPIYSDISNIHDYVVQADNAFDETIKGILNLKKYGQKVEVRVVIHKQTYERLPQLANFLARNLLFVDHVALMGLEMMGFSRPNIEDLWIDPKDYQEQLVEAVKTLARYKMKVSVYNHQLCLLDKRIWSFNRKSISDWKNEYMPECLGCTKMEQCGGFFSSAKFRYSGHIRPFC